MPSIGIYEINKRPIQYINIFYLLSIMDWKLFFKRPIHFTKCLLKVLFKKTKITIDIKLN